MTFLSHELRQEIDSDVNHTIPVLYNISQILCECITRLELDNSQLTLNGLFSIIEQLKVLSKSPKTLKKWVDDNTNLDDILNNLHSHKALYENLTSVKTSILKNFDKEVLEIDYYPILQKFRSEYTTFFKRFGSEYGNYIKYLKVAKTEHSHPLERFNPFTIEP